MKNDRNDYSALLILTRVYPYQTCPFNFRILFYFNYELVLFSIIRWKQDAPVYIKLILQFFFIQVHMSFEFVPKLAAAKVNTMKTLPHHTNKLDRREGRLERPNC